MKKSLLDMGQTLIATGYVPDYKKTGKPPSNFKMKFAALCVTLPVILYSVNLKYKLVNF